MISLSSRSAGLGTRSLYLTGQNFELFCDWLEFQRGCGECGEVEKIKQYLGKKAKM